MLEESAEPAFLRRYLARAGLQLPGRPAADLARIGQRHLDLARRRQPEETLVAVGDLDDGTTSIDIVTSDVAFLVESSRAALERIGHPVRNLLHPQLAVSRDRQGELLEVLDLDDTSTLSDGEVAESWMHIETDDIPADEHASVAEDLRRVLADVHSAVTDGPALRSEMVELAAQIEGNPGQFDRQVSIEAAALLRWLAEGNFLMLGHAAYTSNELATAGSLSRNSANEAGERGVLRGAASVSPLELIPAYRSGAPVVMFKSPLVSTVRRADRYDCVTVVSPASAAAPEKIHVFLGLIVDDADSALIRVPVLRRRFAEVLQRSGARPGSYTGRQLRTALRSLPIDELLQATTPDLLTAAGMIVERAEHGGTGVFARVHLNRDFVTVLVYFPAERLGPETRASVRNIVLSNWPGSIIGRDDRIVELGMARMYFLVSLRAGMQVPEPDLAAVEATIARVTRRWSDDLADLLTVGVGEQEAIRILRRYAGAIPEAYKEDFPAATAVSDLRKLEALDDPDGLGFEIYTPGPGDGADRRLKIYRTGTSLSLGRTLPMLERMGIEVLDERPYEFERTDGTGSWVYDFGLKLGDGVDFSSATAAAVLDTLRVLWRGGIEQDGFNALVLRAHLRWQQVVVLRSYSKYLRQAGTAFSEGYIEQTLIANPAVARLLIELFEARFDPERDSADRYHADRNAVEQDGAEPGGANPDVELIRSRLTAALSDVTSLDHDRILRSLLGLIEATLRTNFYQDAHLADPLAGTSWPVMPLAVKLDSRAIADLPAPRPKVEIWVYSPQVEGVHLRFGAVARGGLRWSDRREDFRTEILGLVKAQMVKNVVIVPVGSKGGFVVKNLPDPAVDRDAWLAAGIAAYQSFITALLELTDNYRPLQDGDSVTVLKPHRTRCYDGDDPYLVVAADKGTATFSDFANEISLARGFWLGDAFASGGSVGYDHKQMGITARGAWESVKYHFRELGVDTQSQEFTVVGIGDMSGDVFGNGMLASPTIKLIAAFDHRHIFLDPDPDSAASLAERQRLFGLDRSSWNDYDRSVTSDGGGVYPRTMKSIPITEAVAAALGLESSPVTPTQLTPTELIHAILIAPVDLLWTAGIGTYVKASAESQLDAGDKANDGVRANGAQLRCRVVGEGGNLGFTQLGRIEFARAGGRINTDAIDNSAGVDTSDHEVNIKIGLDRAVHAGRLPPVQRAALLASVTDDVASLVLRDNYEQNVLLGVARDGAVALGPVHGRLIRALESSGALDRAIEFLPASKELNAREASGAGLTSPELSVLAAYVKIVLAEDLTESTLPEDPWFHRCLLDYFPAPIVQRFEAELSAHPLRREIIVTSVTNDLVNRAGLSFMFRVQEETAASPAQIARAYTVVREVFGLSAIWSALESDGVSVHSLHLAHREVRRLIDRAVRWLIDIRFPLADVAVEIDRYGPAVAQVGPLVSGFLCGEESANLAAETSRLADAGIPADTAAAIASLLSLFQLLDVVEIAISESRPVIEVAELHFALSDQLGIESLLTAVTKLPREDRWSSLARAAMRHDVYTALAAITTSVLRVSGPSLSAGDRIAEWMSANSERVLRARTTLNDALAREVVDLATLSVVLRVLRNLAV